MKKLDLYISEKLKIDKDSDITFKPKTGDIKDYNDLLDYIKSINLDYEETVYGNNKVIIIKYKNDITLELEFSSEREYWYSLYVGSSKWFYTNMTSRIEKVDWTVKLQMSAEWNTALEKIKKGKLGLHLCVSGRTNIP